MLRHVGGWAQLGAIILFALTLISCGRMSNQIDLPDPSGNFAITTTGYAPVVLVVLPGGNGICTGTFISEKAVLTAAHCVLTAGTYQVMASFGTFSTSTRVRLGAGVVDDPNDIALLIFNSNVADRSQGQVYDLHSSVKSGDTLRLVGFGCNNLSTRSGAGTKRTGTNVVVSTNEYVEFLTPANLVGYSARGIAGPDNRAASCFGDSGGPALAAVNGGFEVVAVTHAGGVDGSDEVSQYVNVADRDDNRDFLTQANSAYNLGIQGL